MNHPSHTWMEFYCLVPIKNFHTSCQVIYCATTPQPTYYMSYCFRNTIISSHFTNRIFIMPCKSIYKLKHLLPKIWKINNMYSRNHAYLQNIIPNTWNQKCHIIRCTTKLWLEFLKKTITQPSLHILIPH